jgi:glycosyltransferase involved in cell wall biosynthesis
MKIFIDCTDTHVSRSNTGIQRVVRSFVAHASDAGRAFGVECIPVAYHDAGFIPITTVNPAVMSGVRRSLRQTLDQWYFRIAHFVARLLPWPPAQRFMLSQRQTFGLAWMLYSPVALWNRIIRKPPDTGRAAPQPAEMRRGDILYLPDAAWCTDSMAELRQLRARGVRIVILLYDIIPLTHPELCNPGHVTRFGRWFGDIRGIVDAMLCISRFTLSDCRKHFPETHRIPAEVTYLGEDLPAPSVTTIGHKRLAAALDTQAPVFLCVGTLDARKNQVSLLEAFERVWARHPETRLILIGRPGWRSDALVRRIRAHMHFDRELFWFDDVHDADLVLSYARARALVFPSISEGFGLPLVEALSLAVPVLASDIEVFREIGQSWVRYFDPAEPAQIAESVLATLSRTRDEDAQAAQSFSWPSWEDSTRGMIDALVRLAPADRQAARS